MTNRETATEYIQRLIDLSFEEKLKTYQQRLEDGRALSPFDFDVAFARRARLPILTKDEISEVGVALQAREIELQDAPLAFHVHEMSLKLVEGALNIEALKAEGIQRFTWGYRKYYEVNDFENDEGELHAQASAAFARLVEAKQFWEDQGRDTEMTFKSGQRDLS